MIRKRADHEEQRSFLYDSRYPAPTGATASQFDREAGKKTDEFTAQS